MSVAACTNLLRSQILRNLCSIRPYSHQTCWKCEKDAGTSHFCSAYGNLFEYVGLPRLFEIDEDALKKRFRDLQFKLHPDKFAQSSSKEKELSEEHSRQLNKAYRTLSEPLARANYILKLEGVSKKSDLNQEALIGLMERNERIASLIEEDELKVELEKAKEDIEEEMDAMSEAFGHGNYTKACYQYL